MVLTFAWGKGEGEGDGEGPGGCVLVGVGDEVPVGAGVDIDGAPSNRSHSTPNEMSTSNSSSLPNTGVCRVSPAFDAPTPTNSLHGFDSRMRHHDLWPFGHLRRKTTLPKPS